jgi:hypothetical protein
MMSFLGGSSTSGPLWVTCVFQCFSNIWPDNIDPEWSQLEFGLELMVLESIGLGYKRFDPRALLVTLHLSGRTG